MRRGADLENNDEGDDPAGVGVDRVFAHGDGVGSGDVIEFDDGLGILTQARTVGHGGSPIPQKHHNPNSCVIQALPEVYAHDIFVLEPAPSSNG